MARTTVRDIRAAFLDYVTAYADAGLGTTEHYWDRETGASGTYRSTALDLILTEPDQFRGGSIAVSPWHNPVNPQRYPGASGYSRPAGVERLGDTRAECVATLRAATATLRAVLDAEDTARDYYAPRRKRLPAAERRHLDALHAARSAEQSRRIDAILNGGK